MIRSLVHRRHPPPPKAKSHRRSHQLQNNRVSHCHSHLSKELFISTTTLCLRSHFQDVLEGTLVVSTPEAWDCKAINLRCDVSTGSRERCMALALNAQTSTQSFTLLLSTTRGRRRRTRGIFRLAWQGALDDLSTFPPVTKATPIASDTYQ